MQDLISKAEIMNKNGARGQSYLVPRRQLRLWKPFSTGSALSWSTSRETLTFADTERSVSQRFCPRHTLMKSSQTVQVTLVSQEQNMHHHLILHFLPTYYAHMRQQS